MSNKAVRSRYDRGTPQDGSELHVWGGIVSARVADLADALDATPEELLEALEEVEPLVDTAAQKRQERERPTDPQLRSVALQVGDLETLREELRFKQVQPEP